MRWRVWLRRSGQDGGEEEGLSSSIRVRDCSSVVMAVSGSKAFRDADGSFSMTIFDLGAGLEGARCASDEDVSGVVGWKS